MATFRAHVVDIEGRRTYPAEITVQDGRVAAMTPVDGPVEGYLLPGFVDAHVHVESSMLTPGQFARLAVVHGTVATVSDPHEIANVLGVEGVDLMIAHGAQVPFHFFFGAPSCVPATAFETAGARIDADAVGRLLDRPEIQYLSEVMDFPGVLKGDPELMAKVQHALRRGKRVDGHAPGLRGSEAAQYIAAGISTDHECFTAEEALDKLRAGMKVQIREGSAARNFEALIDLLPAHAADMMFCSDDKHPDSLVAGHIDQLCARAVARGLDVYDVLRVACLNAADHYGLPLGRLRVGDPADMVLVEDLHRFRVQRTWVRGQLVAADGRAFFDAAPCPAIGPFHCSPKTPAQLRVPAAGQELLVIEALDGQLITRKRWMAPNDRGDQCLPDPARDLLKIVVADRYTDRPPAVGWIHGFGLQRGALAGSVAHDSHNIVAVGVDDEALCAAINAVIEARGGIAVAGDGTVDLLPLPIGGLMTDADAYTVAADYQRLDQRAKALGAKLEAPFMTLSFMALLVIPHLKMSDQGLFDGDAMRLINSPLGIPIAP